MNAAANHHRIEVTPLARVWFYTAHLDAAHKNGAPTTAAHILAAGTVARTRRQVDQIARNVLLQRKLSTLFRHWRSAQ